MFGRVSSGGPASAAEIGRGFHRLQLFRRPSTAVVLRINPLPVPATSRDPPAASDSGLNPTTPTAGTKVLRKALPPANRTSRSGGVRKAFAGKAARRDMNDSPISPHRGQSEGQRLRFQFFLNVGVIRKVSEENVDRIRRPVKRQSIETRNLPANRTIRLL